MRKIFTRMLPVLLFAAGLFSFNQASASHIMGSDISYRCLGGNTYEVSVTIYRDCSGIAVPTSIPVEVSSSCGTQTVTCPLDNSLSGQEVSQLCPTAVSTCQGGSLPGVEVYVYVGQVTIQPNCGLYTFSYSDCCRNPDNNLVNPTSAGFSVTATLNSNLVNCDNAPAFTSLPVPYFCLGQQVNYSHGAIDDDGDSLVYTLIPPVDDFGAPVAYTGGYSATNPLPTSGGFNFDAQTGQMTFVSTQQGVYVVDVLVQEYRNGVLIGSTMRDIQIVIINCTNNSPSVANCLNTNNSNGGVVVDCNSLGVCPGQTVTFTIPAYDPDGQPLTVTSNIANAIPGATLTTQQVGGPDSLLLTFTWTPSGLDTGYRYFTLQVADNACPIPGIQLFTYDITVLDGTDAGPDKFYCTGGGPVTIPVYGGNHFTWNTTYGFVSSTPDSNLVQVAPLQTTTYIVTSDLQGGCKNKDTVTVFNVQTFSTSLSAVDDTICLNSGTDITAVGIPSNQGPFTYSWAPTSAGILAPTAQTTEVRPVTTTMYYVTVTSAAGCPVKDSIQIVIQGVGPKIAVTPTSNYVCPGSPITLNSIVKPFECGPVADPNNPCFPGSTFDLKDVGTGTSNGGNSITPYTGFWMDGRVQYLYRASELQAMGLGAGAITDIAFNVISKNSTAPYNAFTIKMGGTNLNSLPTNYVGGLTQVVNPNAYTTTLGWNTHTLDIPYLWDGFSNLIVEVCYDNSAWTGYDNVEYSTTTFTNSVLWQAADLGTASGCTGLNAPAQYATRPNLRMIMCKAPLNNYNFTWTGSDGTTLPDTSAPSLNLYHDVDYTVVVSDGTCQGDTTVSLHVDTAVLISAGPDVAFCNGDTAQLNMQLLHPVVPQCLPSYTITNIAYNPISPVAPPTNGPSGDDVMSSALPIGFNFDFFCNSYSSIYACTNGFITFSTGQPTSFTATALPTAATPNNIIALCWRDLNLTTGNIQYFTTGTAPNRTFVIRYVNAPAYNGTGNLTGEIHLRETTNVIEVLVSSMNATGVNNTLGVENATGTIGFSPTGYNLTNWTVSSPVAFRFTPDVTGAGLTGVNWTPSLGLSSTTIQNPKAYPAVTTDYVVQANFSNGCSTYDTVKVAIGNFPHTLVASPDTICQGTSSQLVFTGNGVSYSWTPTASLSSATAQSPNATPAATTLYHVTAFDSIGCRVDDSVQVFVRTHAAITLGPDQSICPYDSVTLNPTGGPYTSYSWSTGATTATINTAAQTATTQDYWVRVNDGFCFYNSDTVTVTEFTLNPIVVQPSGDTGVCIGNVITLGADAGYVSYLWNTGDTTQTITTGAGGYYSYTAIDLNGCVLHSLDSVHVIPAQHPAANIIVSDDTICAGQTTATLSVVPVTGIVYTWAQPVTVDTVFTVSTAGTYSLTASDNGCISTSTVEIFSTNPPTIELGADQNLCSCDTAVLLDAGIPGSYVWSTGDSTRTISPSASGTYAVTVTDFNSCTVSDQVTLTIRCLTVDAVVADPASGTVFVGHNAGLNATTSYSSTYGYQWVPSTYLDDSTKQSPSVQSPQVTTNYQVIVTDLVNGCVASDTVKLVVVPPGIPPMPNAFTPNGDGHNDTYGPYIPQVLQGVYTIAEMRIYNRWGTLVYDGNGNWDGTYNGVLQPSDTYVYYVTIVGPDQSNPNTNIQYNLTGSFTLLH
ncbi:MAG: gliding motility-associated C-terminal domain-containing protein [Chitinophagales bacterium]